MAFCLVSGFIGAAGRQYRFILKGLAEVESVSRAKGIPFYLLSGNPVSQIPRFINKAGAGSLVTVYELQWLQNQVRRKCLYPEGSGAQLSLQMLKLRMDANVTHSRYGTSSLPAKSEIFQNSSIVSSIKTHKTTISKKAAMGECNPKKMIDHRELSANCIPKRMIAFLTLTPCKPLFCQTR
jgi:hypothetical protein